MASGDKDNPFPFTLAETRAILRLPIVERMMARRIKLNATDWDIPYLAGYSQDGRTIYIDRDLPEWPYRGATINTDRFLTIHEDVEKALIDAIHEADDFDRRVLLDCLRMKTPHDQIYFHCHGVATCAELYAVQQAGIEVAAYNKFAKKQIKRAEDERIRRVPRNLDLTPYTSSETPNDVRLLRRMRRVMK